LKKILNIASYELIHIFKDPILFLIVFFVPILYAALFGIVYVQGVLDDIPLAIVDLDNSELSRDVITAFRTSPHFRIVDEIKTYPDLEKGMKEGTIRAGVVIPEDFKKNVISHRNPPLLTIYDGSNLIWGYNTRKNLLEVTNKFMITAAARYMGGLGMTEQEIKDVLDTVSCSTYVWYNPTFNYSNFLFMGLVMMIIHQIGFLSIGLTITREKEKNSWIQYLAAPVPHWQIFLGKSLPYFIMNFFNYGLLLWFAARFVHVKIWGDTWLIILLGLLYTIIIIATGYFVSYHAPNSLQVTRYLMLLSVPFFMISGYTWPATHIPEYLNLLAKALPFTWMAEGFRIATIKELGFAYIKPNILALSVMAVLAVALALSCKKRRKPPQEHGLIVNSGVSYPAR